ncbi:MAG: acetyl-CoA carboxylase biotin carboxyl carrier protein [bacterium]
MKIDIEYIEQLVKLFKDNELTELSVEEGEKAIVLRKEKEVVATSVQAPTVTQVSTPAPVAATPAKAEAPQDKGIAITSPMVGSFYKAANPGSPAFTEVGKTISAGQVVCIIEAMKLMNEIESEVSGTVVEICVQDGQPVEYGQVLMYVKP